MLTAWGTRTNRFAVVGLPRLGEFALKALCTALNWREKPANWPDRALRGVIGR
jgi:hypothetical protein